MYTFLNIECIEGDIFRLSLYDNIKQEECIKTLSCIPNCILLPLSLQSSIPSLLQYLRNADYKHQFSPGRDPKLNMVRSIKQITNPFCFFGGINPGSYLVIDFTSYSTCMQAQRYLKDYVYGDPASSTCQHFLNYYGIGYLSTLDENLNVMNDIRRYFSVSMYTSEEKSDIYMYYSKDYLLVKNKFPHLHPITIKGKPLLYSTHGVCFIEIEFSRDYLKLPSETDWQQVGYELITLAWANKTTPILFLMTSRADRLWNLIQQQDNKMWIPCERQFPRDYSRFNITQDVYSSIKVEGGSIISPPTGKITSKEYDIVTLDFKSFYPSIMIAHNLCPSTTRGLETFTTEEIGIIPKLLKTLLHLRTIYPNCSKALKLTANAVFGLLAATWSDFGSRHIARETTSLGRKYIQEAYEYFNSIEGMTVLYSHTDSLIVRKRKNLDICIPTFPKPITLEIQSIHEGVFFLATNYYVLFNPREELKIHGLLAIQKSMCHWQKQQLLQAYYQVFEQDLPHLKEEYTLKDFKKTMHRPEPLLPYLPFSKLLSKLPSTGENINFIDYVIDINKGMIPYSQGKFEDINYDAYLLEIQGELKRIAQLQEISEEFICEQKRKRTKFIGSTIKHGITIDDAIVFFEKLALRIHSSASSST